MPRITIAPCPRIYTPIPRLTLPALSRARRLGRSGIHWSFASSATSLTAATSVTISSGQADLLAGERLAPRSREDLFGAGVTDGQAGPEIVDARALSFIV